MRSIHDIETDIHIAKGAGEILEPTQRHPSRPCLQKLLLLLGKSYCFCSGPCNARCIPTYGYRRVHAIPKRQARFAMPAALSGDMTAASPSMSAIAAQTDAL